MSRPPAPFFYLRPDETVLRKEGAAQGYAFLWFLAAAAPLTVLATAAAFASLLLPRSPLAPPAIGALYAALLGVAGLVSWRRWATTEYVLTDARIYARTGRLVTRVHFATHDKVTDVRYRQGPLERLLGISSLSFRTAGGDVAVRGVVDAIAVKEVAERARDAFVQRLLEEAGLERAPPAARGAADGDAPGGAHDADRPAARPPPPPLPEWTGPRPEYVKAGDVPAWHAQPVGTAALAALKPFLGVFAILLLSATLRGAFGPWLLPAAIGIALAAVGLRALQLRRTEYLATDHRVYARTGLVGTTVRQLTYDKITDITYEQDLLGRLLGYGTVTLTTAGGTDSAIALHALRRPLQAKEEIEALRARSLGESTP